VNTDHQRDAVRRYLLGEASEKECEAIEREYFKDESVLSDVESEEEALIDEYLDGRLNARQRELFEGRYLASPIHRRRVDTIRRLSAMKSSAVQPLPTAGGARWFPYQWVALAASLIFVVGAVWLLRPGRPAPSPASVVSDRPPSDASTPASQPSPLPTAPPPTPALRVLAFSLPPIQTRGTDDASQLVVPAGTDVVALQLEGTNERARLNRMRAEIRTMTGQEVWKGTAAGTADLRSGTVARLDVPAAALPANDYIVTLFETPATGSERELDRYFLRVR
jgi:hypothetical protein